MEMLDALDSSLYRDLVRQALAEDVGAGDVTTRAIVPASLGARAVVLAKSPCVLAGLDVVGEVLRQVDPTVRWQPRRRDGDRCAAGDEVAEASGPAAALLIAERTALNFLQQLSGIATLTRRFVDAAGGRLVVLDTRKTVPTFRMLAKYAVRCGGGTNHRIGLFDAVVIKDNHIRIAGGIAEAVRRVREAGAPRPIEVECQSLPEVDQAIEAGADIIMLDNLSDDQMREAVRRIAGRARTEVSGGITLERMARLSALGIDTASIGALTHSAPAADISFEIDSEPVTAAGRGSA